MAKQTFYEFLLAKQDAGEMKTLFALGLPSYYALFLDIYAFHLAHHDASQFDMALEFDTSKKTVYRAIHTLSATVPD